ncbi:MAG: EAL domain-containing protein [Sciscionella sp.]|nr:EAL domain-containing protein [Sciscionella sp.]
MDQPIELGAQPSRLVYRLLSVTVLAVGVLGSAALAVALPPNVDGHLWLSGPLLAIGFLLAEQLTIDLNVRRIDWTISFTEIPLVLGLLFAPFWIVLAAHLLAGLAIQWRRKATAHMIYNAGVMCLEVAAPFAVFALLCGRFAGAPRWLPAVPATLSSPLVSTALGLFALSTIGSGLSASATLRLSGRTLVLGLLNTSVGLVCYEVAVSAPGGVALVCMFAVALVPLYLAYSSMLREQRDLEALAEFSLSVTQQSPSTQSGPPGLDDVAAVVAGQVAIWQSIAERIRDQIAATRVVLRLRLDPTEPEITTVVAGLPLPDAEPAASRALHDDPLVQLPGSGVSVVRLDDAPSPATRSALRQRGAHEAMVVQLRGTNDWLGTIEVHDRASRWRGFGRADVRVLAAMASHLATAAENRRLLTRLRYDVHHDPATGLLNRSGFGAAAAGPLRAHPHSVLLCVDLDVLSTVSDALGYAWGDRLVVAAGRRLREELGDAVPLARLEGGVFVALLAGADETEAIGVAQRLRDALSKPYPVDRVTVEAGAVVCYVSAAEALQNQHERLDVDTLLQRADVVVRTARTDGTGIRGYSASMGQLFMRRFHLVTQFRQALENGEITVHYQPKLALPSRRVLGVEALVRWQHPEWGMLGPDEFIPAVEATGLVDPLTTFVTEQVLGKLRKWANRGMNLTAAVNLSVRSLADEQFPDMVADALRRHEIPAERLTFELTESQVMADPARALPVLRRLHELGVVLAVDDFGTGYSSLAYLRQLPVDEVKIDKSFVLSMGTDLGDLAVVRSIVELGHSLGLTVVAEGVEDDAARDALVTMGCDVAQGYLISRPLPADKLEAWLRARTTRSRGPSKEFVLTLMH